MPTTNGQLTNGQLYGPDGDVLTFAEEVPPDETMEQVVGRPSFTMFRSLIGAMPDITNLEAEEGEDIWDRMLDDGHVWAAQWQIKNRILSKEVDLVPADDSDRATEIKAHVREQLRRVDFQDAVEHLLRALTHKYSVVELVWGKPEGGSRPLERVQPHERRHFGLDEEETLYFQLAQMEEVPPYKFVHFVMGHRPKRPYGRSLLKSAYWPWRFKQMGWESWSMALDKLGVPSLAALLEGNIDVSSERGQDTLAEVRTQLEKMANGGVGAFSGVESIETVGGSDSSQGGQMPFMKFCNAEISKAIMTATLQLEEGREDAERGDTKVHDAAAEDVAQYVATKLEGRIGEQLIKPIVFLEFGEEALDLAPRLRWDFRERATFDEVKGAMEEGVPLSKNLLEQDYNLPVAEEGADDAFVSKNVRPGPATELADDGKKKGSVIPDPSERVT